MYDKNNKLAYNSFRKTGVYSDLRLSPKNIVPKKIVR